jgi:hypothetical protein
MVRTLVLLAVGLAMASPQHALAGDPAAGGEQEPPWVSIESEAGAVIVEAVADEAAIFVDGRARGVVTPGARLAFSLDDGIYRIAVEVRGYERYERTIAIRNGETATLRETLAKAPPPEEEGEVEVEEEPEAPVAIAPPVSFGPPSMASVQQVEADGASRNLRAWRIALWTSVGVSFAGGVLALHGAAQIRDAEERLLHHDDPFDPAVRQLTEQGLRGERLGTAGAVLAGAGGVIALVSAYKIYLAPRRAEARSRAAAIAPIVGAHGAGAVVRVAW